MQVLAIKFSVEAEALLVTEDKDFGELVFVQRLTHSGVLPVRLNGLDPGDRAERVAETIEQNEFAVVS